MDRDPYKWSRNLSIDESEQTTRQKLLERQRQLMETKRARAAQGIMASGGGGPVIARPVTAAASRARQPVTGSTMPSESAYAASDRRNLSSASGARSASQQQQQQQYQDPWNKSKTNLAQRKSLVDLHTSSSYCSSIEDLDGGESGGGDVGGRREHRGSDANSLFAHDDDDQPFGRDANSDRTRSSRALSSGADLLIGAHMTSGRRSVPESTLIDVTTSGLTSARSQASLLANKSLNSNTTNSRNGKGGKDAADKDGDRESGESEAGGSPERTPLSTVMSTEELLEFSCSPVPTNRTYQCTIIRDKRGLDRSFYPSYYMHLQAIISHDESEEETLSKGHNNNNPQSGKLGGVSAAGAGGAGGEDPSTLLVSGSPPSRPGRAGDGDAKSPLGLAQSLLARASARDGPVSLRQVFVLSGRRRKKSKTYLISTDPFDISRENCVAKVKSNVIGTQFNALRVSNDKTRCEMASIFYETNVLGFKGPRKMQVLLSKPDQYHSRSPHLALMDEYKRNPKSVMQLRNKTPVWNEDTQSYVLNFHGRVTQASVKNFQLVPVSEDEGEMGGGSLLKSTSTTPLVSMSTSQSTDSMHHRLDDSIMAHGGRRGDPLSPDRTSTMPIAPVGGTSPPSSLASRHRADLVSMQFGRVSDREFTCDVSWPLSLMQAFSIALSSFDSKLACE